MVLLAGQSIPETRMHSVECIVFHNDCYSGARVSRRAPAWAVWPPTAALRLCAQLKALLAQENIYLIYFFREAVADQRGALFPLTTNAMLWNI